MKKLALAGGLLFPHFLQAQAIDDAVYKRAAEASQGYYWLTAAPTARQAGELKLRNGDALVVKSATGFKQVLTPEQVIFFRIGQHRYATEMVEVAAGVLSRMVKRQFVEQLDSGEVMLTYYKRYVYNNGPVDEYLLRGPKQVVASPLYWNLLGVCKDLPERMLPFVNARPDLAKILREYKLSPADLRALIDALNNGRPFSYVPQKAVREPKPAKERPVESPF